MTATHTALDDVDHKIDLIDHINHDHADEVLAIIRAYSDKRATHARILDIFMEGCLIACCVDGAEREVFIPFVLQGDPEENILYLAYNAMVRQGKPINDMRKQYFTVQAVATLSPHILRLRLHSKTPLPEHAPGFAWFFSLKILAHLPNKIPSAQNKLSKIAQWGNRLMLWWMKHLSRARRKKILLSFSKGMRYYTLRHAERSTPDAECADTAFVDVFIHGDTAGSLWASGLKTGDVIHSTASYHEHTNHLQEGMAVLIGDETALPTVAALLENWCNPQAPTVIAITQDVGDQIYLHDKILPPGSVIHRISGTADIAAAVIEHLQTLPRIDTVWGALENEDAKIIRRYLRQEHTLDGKRNRVKGYWHRTDTDGEQT